MTEGEKNKNIFVSVRFIKSFSQNGERNMPDWDIWAVR